MTFFYSSIRFLAGFLVCVAGGSYADSGTDAALHADRLMAHLNHLATMGKTADGGTSRVAYSDFDVQGRHYVTGLMKHAGLTVRTDYAGNIIGEKSGTDNTLPAIVLGSHIDTVVNGGNYDGIVGVLSSIEVLQSFSEKGIVTKHPVKVVAFQNEEGGLYGSKYIAGILKKAELKNSSFSGKTIEEGIDYIGGDTSKMVFSQPSIKNVLAFVEYHIEQGPVLSAKKKDIGVVSGIVGVYRWKVSITGFANHAGTTPMNKRQDALLSAAQFITLVNKTVNSIKGSQVATVGHIQAYPNNVNVIAGKVELSLEIRALDTQTINRLYQTIDKAGKKIAKDNHTEITIQEVSVQQPTTTNDSIQGYIAESAHELGLTTQTLPSGAGHDTQSMAQIAPVGMIFIPSKNGISHSPKEFSYKKDVANGARVLAETVLKIDQKGL